MHDHEPEQPDSKQESAKLIALRSYLDSFISKGYPPYYINYLKNTLDRSIPTETREEFDFYIKLMNQRIAMMKRLHFYFEGRKIVKLSHLLALANNPEMGELQNPPLNDPRQFPAIFRKELEAYLPKEEAEKFNALLLNVLRLANEKKGLRQTLEGQLTKKELEKLEESEKKLNRLNVSQAEYQQKLLANFQNPAVQEKILAYSKIAFLKKKASDQMSQHIDELKEAHAKREIKLRNLQAGKKQQVTKPIPPKEFKEEHEKTKVSLKEEDRRLYREAFVQAGGTFGYVESHVAFFMGWAIFGGDAVVRAFERMKKAWDTAKDNIKQVWNNSKGIFDGVEQVTKYVFKSAWNSTVNKAEAAWKYAKENKLKTTAAIVLGSAAIAGIVCFAIFAAVPFTFTCLGIGLAAAIKWSVTEFKKRRDLTKRAAGLLIENGTRLGEQRQAEETLFNNLSSANTIGTIRDLPAVNTEKGYKPDVEGSTVSVFHRIRNFLFNRSSNKPADSEDVAHAEKQVPSQKPVKKLDVVVHDESEGEGERKEKVEDVREAESPRSRFHL